MNVLNEVQEYIIYEPIPSTSEDLKKEYKWSQNETKLLIDLYAKYKKKVGTLEIKNAKVMWQVIARELNASNVEVESNNCINRSRVLERNYKKFVDNKNKTGRGRKYFEYENEMNEIFGKKKNVNPELILSNETMDNNLVDTCDEELSKEKTDPNVTPTKTQMKLNLKKTRAVKKQSTLQYLRLDRKLYYEEKLKIERERLEELKKRNQLIEEKNTILRELVKKDCHCSSVSLL